MKEKDNKISSSYVYIDDDGDDWDIISIPGESTAIED